MQVEIKKINAVNKEITLVVEAERAMKMYQKYLSRASREVAVPGFRKGKAPLSMVERMYADRVMDLFYKEMVDDCFDEAARDHDIHYLLYPEVKDITWEKNEPMTIIINLETEPVIDFKQLEGLQIPHKPLTLETEVENYITSLLKENAYMIDVEGAALAGDELDGELTYELNGEKIVHNINLVTESSEKEDIYSLLIGKTIGDTIELSIPGVDLAVLISDNTIAMETEYPSLVMVNAIRRKMVPELNDEFAKDLDFDSLEAMKEKISEDMKLANEHKNISIKHSSIISKLYVDNQFDLPEKTLNHIASKEVEKIDNPQWKAYYEYQVKMQITQEMINVYTLNNLKREINIELTDEDIDIYITHNAILEDKTVDAWKEGNKDFLDKPEFKESVKNFVILNQLAAKSEFVLAENPPAEYPELDSIMQDSPITEAEIVEEEQTSEIQAEIFEETTEAK